MARGKDTGERRFPQTLTAAALGKPAPTPSNNADKAAGRHGRSNTLSERLFKAFPGVFKTCRLRPTISPNRASAALASHTRSAHRTGHESAARFRHAMVLGAAVVELIVIAALALLLARPIAYLVLATAILSLW
jgi:hypothetical protein